MGREPEGFHALVELAETAGIPVYDVDSRLNFPTRHPLNMSHSKDVFRDADLVLCLDTRDWERPTTELVSTTRQLTSIVPASATWIDIGFGDLELSSWALDYQRLRHARLQILADTTIAIPAVTRLLEARIAKDAKLRARIKARTADTAAKSQRAAREMGARGDRWTGTRARSRCRASPPRSGTRSRARTGSSRPARSNSGRASSGTSTSPIATPDGRSARQPNSAFRLGVALAHREEKRLVVDMQPDGDLMFDAGAMWVAAKHRIPMLVVMYNNRAYYNDWEHQIRMAKLRGTPVERAHIGMDMDDPAPDFAAMAKSMGWYAEGPFESPEGGRRGPEAGDRAGEGGPPGAARHRHPEAIEAHACDREHPEAIKATP